MTEKTFIVQFKRPLQTIQHVVAATAEIHGEHLVFLDSQGKLVALCLLETVQSWNEIQAQKDPDIARGG